MSGFSTIVDRVPLPELLNQLAEECAELAQAALKYRRAIEGTNYTPVSAYECRKNLLEEIADVCLTEDVLIFKLGNPMELAPEIKNMQIFKETRWARRLTDPHICGPDYRDIGQPPTELDPPRME